MIFLLKNKKKDGEISHHVIEKRGIIFQNPALPEDEKKVNDYLTKTIHHIMKDYSFFFLKVR